MFALVVSLIVLGLPQNAGSDPAGAQFTADDVARILAEAGDTLERATAARDAGDPATARSEAARLVALLAPLPLGEGHDATAHILWWGGNVAFTTGDFSGAREAWGRVLDHRERTLPADHPDVLDARGNLAITLLQLGDLAGARALEEAVLEARERIMPVDHSDLLTARGNLAITMKRMGDLAGARVLEEAVLEARERLLPVDHPAVLSARQNLAITMEGMGDLVGARALLEAVLEAQERLLPVDHPDLLSARQNLAITMKEMGDLAGARALEEAVLEAKERILPADHPRLLSARLNLAITMERMGDLAGARSLEETVLEARERLLPADHPRILSARQNLAITMKEMGDLAGARSLEEAVLEARERLLPPDHPHLLLSRQNLAITMKDMGDLPGARVLLEAVLEARERILPADHPDLLQARGNLAATMQQMGDLAGARSLQEAVLEAMERLVPEDHPNLLQARGNLAATIQQMGDVAGARALEEAVLEARERLLPEDHPDLLRTRQNLAITMMRMGDHAGAHELLEAVLETRKRLLPEEHLDLLSARASLASAMAKMGDVAGARALEEAVLEARERLLPEDHPALIASRNNLAIRMKKMGDLAGARALEETVLEARARLLPAHHPSLLASWNNLAVTTKEMGDVAAARAFGQRLTDGMLLRLESLSLLSPREVRESASAEAHWLAMAHFLNYSAGSEGPSPIVYSLIETWRHVVSVPAFAAATGDPEWSRTRKEIQELRERLNDLVAGGVETNQSPDEYAEQVSRLSLERDKLERKLRREAHDRGIQTGLIGPEDVSTNLTKGSTSIGYRRLAGWRQNEETGRIESIGDRLIAHVVRADDSLLRFDLGAAADFEELVHDWRAALGKSVGRGVGVAESAAGREEAGAVLAKRLLAPILEELEGDCTQLHICSDDVLFLVPLDALPLGDGRVGDRYTIVNEISFGRLIRPRPPPESEPSLLALGGAAFGAAPDQVPLVPGVMSAPISSGSERNDSISMFPSLEHTLAEVEAAAVLFEENTGGDAVVLEGVNATKAAFHELAPGRRFLHLATHGWFAPESVPSMLDDQGGGDLWSRTSAMDTVTGLAPSTLCGLAFSGANNGRDSLGRVPGIMTAEELMGIDLSACELAVLSACETNVGIRRAGQGIQSLQAALHAAGVRTAITSLWTVDDAMTRQLMELFYAYLWVEKMPKAEALWRAKSDLRREGAAVRDWAGWVLSGDPD